MSRVQLALNVANIEESIAFYAALFQTQPHKRRPGYANFEIAEPPLKLVLIERLQVPPDPSPIGALNHLGIEVESSSEVHDAMTRATAAGLTALPELNTNCCFAVQDKVWLSDPTGTPWEIYTITDDNPDSAEEASMNDGGCCTPAVSNSQALNLTGSDAGADSCC